MKPEEVNAMTDEQLRVKALELLGWPKKDMFEERSHWVVWREPRTERWDMAKSIFPYVSVAKALILAMKKEKVAFKLYTDLAAAVSSADLKNTFLSLAQEEAKHKLRFEVEYDNEIMGEN